MLGEGLLSPADFGIVLEELNVRQKLALALGEATVGMWGDPIRDNRDLAAFYAEFASKQNLRTVELVIEQ